ncbi:Na(+)/H(+) antiporter subunit D [Candidatus Competibacter phosphatis]|uniref:Na(+)/H(+) antiporter subunit D n=1 Tax=Candidatus Competibacter phosphatis TaxID=221280 RepID=A0ABX1TRM9_9GAMM|nr:Na(+)/H(+) antiporter subunit D [Candidatus Competibacter phosphatis]NMQ20733.1 Na(+)/H(+) antiporter subunit D [Candidatus Competibacter phosphatis]
MIDGLNPALILIGGSLLALLAPQGRARNLFMLALPVLGALQLWGLPYGEYARIELFDLTLTTLRLDGLSFAFALVFHIAALLAIIYAWRLDDPVQQVAGLLYPGAAVGAVLAGDLVTLFICWELAAVSSVFLIWARRTQRAYHAGMRYLLAQIGSGVLLLAGVIVHLRATGSITFEHLGLDSPGGWLIFIAFGIKAAFPLLHNWLQDAYPEATVTGTVLLSAFTTKMAIYALARGFAGTESLITIGTLMAMFPIFYAVIENDLRRVLAYSMNNQLGFMVVGVGIGTPLGLDGAVAHAFADILFKALLFMSMGAVLLRAGTVNGSELGGLYKSMPLTAGLCMVGAASISAFPLFSAFVTKSLILEAAAREGHWVSFLFLLFASAGVFHHAGIKIPFFAFFAHDSGIRCEEAPRNMLVAMGLAAALCVGIGVFPEALYAILPYPIAFDPYTTTHVVTQLQLLAWSALAFSVLVRTGIYPPELRSVNLDFDWGYRKLMPVVATGVWGAVSRGWEAFNTAVEHLVKRLIAGLARHHGQYGVLATTWPTGSMVLWAVVLLGACLIFYYL